MVTQNENARMLLHGRERPYGYHCGYILNTGHSRGCDIGPGCKRYEKRRKNGKNGTT